jgi:hypothetical protein
VAVLGFELTSGDIETLHEKYATLHPDLLPHNGMQEYDTAKVLEVYAFYAGEKNLSGPNEAEKGTMLRFIQMKEDATTIGKKDNTGPCKLPGFTPVDAIFDGLSEPCYFDHWVSNVVSRTGFIDTLNDTLGFIPKVDFNAGVVAAGEAQIESTVAGNTSDFTTLDPLEALKDQSQVYLPINNALSDVGHVHGFLEEVGQGIQHVASKVENLAAFIQRANDYRKITNEGFTFLNIPRSYYGVLSVDLLEHGLPQTKTSKDAASAVTTHISRECAVAIMQACEQSRICDATGALDLTLDGEAIEDLIRQFLPMDQLNEFLAKKKSIVEIALRSRYINLHKLLNDHLTEQKYVDIVRNQILVDVQGEDLLFQIFTSNVMQRKAGEEAPFFEFIQRVCAESIKSLDESHEDAPPPNIKPGCGGFGIRNFLTLFLSIEVSKAMNLSQTSKASGDIKHQTYAEHMVSLFTKQLNESNPILTEISDMMTLEGQARDAMVAAKAKGDVDEAQQWNDKMETYTHAKGVGNQHLMDCSTKYKNLMRDLRENHECENGAC